MLRHFCKVAPFCIVDQGAKKVIFTACHSGKLKLTFTSPFTCPSGKLITEFTSSIAKSTSPGLSDTTFFARRWTYLSPYPVYPNPFPPKSVLYFGPSSLHLLQTTLIRGVRGFTAFKRNEIIIELNV